MNLIYHIFKKDIVRYRVLISLYGILLLLQLVILHWCAHPTLFLQKKYELVYDLGILPFYLLAALLVCLIVQEEPLVGTNAFWLTRPISRSQLLYSKAIIVFIITGSPVLGQALVLYVFEGLTAFDTLSASFEFLIQISSWLLIVMAISSLTQNLLRFLVTAFIFMLTSFGVSIVCLEFPVFDVTQTTALENSRSVVGMVTLILISASVINLQYLGGSIRLSLTVASLGVIASLFLASDWPIAFLGTPIPLKQTSTRTNPVLVGDFNIREASGNNDGNSLKLLGVNIDMQDDVPVDIVSISPELVTGDGKQINVSSQTDIGSNWSAEGNPDLIGKTLGGVTILSKSNQRRLSVWLAGVPTQEFWHYSSTPLHLTAKLKERTFRYQNSAEVPFLEGQEKSFGSRKLRILKIFNQPDGLDVIIRNQRVSLLLAPPPYDISSYWTLEIKYTVYVLLNKVRKEAVLQADSKYDRGGSSNRLVVNQDQTLTFPLTPSIDNDWVKDATLVRLDLIPLADEIQTLDVPDFRMDGKFPRPK